MREQETRPFSQPAGSADDDVNKLRRTVQSRQQIIDQPPRPCGASATRTHDSGSQ